MNQNQNQNQNLILVVDDEPDICGEISGFLSENGYQTIVAKEGREALELFVTHKPILVLTDFMMPELNGIELLKRVKCIKREINVIMMSGVADIKTTVTALKEDAFDFLAKPIDLEELLAKIRSAIQRTMKNSLVQTSTPTICLSHEVLSTSPPASVLFFHVKLDEYNSDRYRSEFHIIIADQTLNKAVIFNLERTNYINNVGLNMLVELKEVLEARGHDVHMCNLNNQVNNYLSVLGYENYFNVEMCLEDVVGKLHLAV